MGGLFSLVSNVVGIGFQLYGQGQAEQAASEMASANESIAVFRAQQQAAQYALYATMQQRSANQALRQAQSANAAGFAAQVNQGGGAPGSSAAGGSRGQVGGELSTAISGINENMDFAARNEQLNQQIDTQQIRAAQAGAQLANAQGTMNLGRDISQIGSAFGNLLGGGSGLFSSLFSNMGSSGGQQMVDYPNESVGAFG